MSLPSFYMLYLPIKAISPYLVSRQWQPHLLAAGPEALAIPVPHRTEHMLVYHLSLPCFRYMMAVKCRVTHKIRSSAGSYP